MAEQRVHIVGVGDDGAAGLTSAARQIVDQAEILIGGAKTLQAVAPRHGQQIEVGGDLQPVIDCINHHGGRRIVVLATGDPLFYGTARYLCDRLGKQRFEVVPHVSSMQLAFARVKESWDDAYLANLATQPLDRVIERVRTAEKVGLFTTESITPSHLAAGLLERQIDYFTAYVCENLGSPDERVTVAELEQLARQSFGPLNVMILIRKPNAPDRPRERMGLRLFGNPDEAFLQSQPKRGLLTPAEVRTIALADLDLGPRSVVWDVGAGSGSVAIEAAQLAPDGQVFAIEMDAEDHQLIRANAERFGVINLQAVLGTAPEAWADLPNPDAVFVGGTGRQVARIAEQAFQRLNTGGRIVVNLASLDNLAAVYDVLRIVAGDAEVRMVQLARGTMQIDSLRLESLNPTFLITALRQAR